MANLISKKSPTQAIQGEVQGHLVTDPADDHRHHPLLSVMPDGKCVLLTVGIYVNGVLELRAIIVCISHCLCIKGVTVKQFRCCQLWLVLDMVNFPSFYHGIIFFTEHIYIYTSKSV